MAKKCGVLAADLAPTRTYFFTLRLISTPSTGSQMSCESIACSSDSAVQELRFNSKPHHKLPQVVRQEVSTSERRPAVGLGRRRLPKFGG